MLISRIVNTLWEMAGKKKHLHLYCGCAVWRRQKSLAKSFKSDEKQLFAFRIKKFLLLVALKTWICGKEFVDKEESTMEVWNRESCFHACVENVYFPKRGSRVSLTSKERKLPVPSIAVAWVFLPSKKRRIPVASKSSP